MFVKLFDHFCVFEDKDINAQAFEGSVTSFVSVNIPQTHNIGTV